MFVVAAVIALVPLALRAESDLRVLPILNGDERLMDAVAQQIVVIPNDAIVVACAVNFFCLSTPIGDFAAVGGVLDDFADIGRAEQLAPGVPVVQLQDAVALQILRDEPPAHLFMHIQVEDQPDSFGLFLVDDQMSVDEVIAVGRKAAVPFTLAGLLDAALHGLHADVLALNLRYRGEHRDHQLARILGGVNAVLHTDQVHAEVLHDLKGGEHVGGVAAEARELEYQNVGDVVFAALDVLHHVHELGSPLDGFAGFACIFVFADNFVVIKLGVCFHAVPLCFKRVAVDLHGGGYAGICVHLDLLIHTYAP